MRLPGALALAAILVLASSGPVHVSYVTSDSMTPTIDEGDGFLLVPAGTVHPDDIITFYSPTRDEYVTHRVIGTTDAGYVTKGDDNRLSDQATGHPPVSDDHVRGVALSVRGTPITVPGVGSAIQHAYTHWWAIIIGGIATIGLTRWDGRVTPRSRAVIRERHLVLPLVIGVIGGSVVALLIGAPAVSATFAVVDHQPAADHQLPVGESVSRTVSFELADRPFTHRFVVVTGADLARLENGADGYEATLVVPPPSETGAHEVSVRVYQYPAVLPYGLTASLHSVHPLGAATMTVLVATCPVWLGYWLVSDWRTPLTRGRDGSWWARNP